MFHLRLFGGASIRDAEGAVLSGRAAQRHRLALLARLALAPARELSRDRLIASLWPERDVDRGRNLLNVSVYVLRKALGQDVLLSRGTGLRLGPERIRVDAAEFHHALDHGDRTHALSLYRGPLLDGFFLQGAPEFERWAEEQRRRARRRAAAAFGSLAEERLAAGDLAGAAYHARRAVETDTYDEAALRRLIRILDRRGDRAGAVLAYRRFAARLEREIGVGPAPETQRLIEGVRTRGDVPTPSTAADADGVAGSPGSAEPAGDATGESARPTRDTRVGPLGERSLAVLPFDDLGGDPDRQYFSDGVTGEIIAEVSNLPGVTVISRTSAMRYRGSRSSLRVIADELGVAHILEGTVQRADGRVRITARLIDAANDRHLWAERYDHAEADIFRIQREVASSVARALAVELDREDGPTPVGVPTEDPEAHNLYLQGRFLWHQRAPQAVRRSLDYFRRAIDRDAGYAAAHAALADAYVVLGAKRHLPRLEAAEKARPFAERAVALDPRSADAHVALGGVAAQRRRWREAERQLGLAIELNPNHALAHHWLSFTLLSGFGRREEALDAKRRAARLDPLAPQVLVALAWQLYLQGHYRRAIAEYRKVMDLHPGFDDVHWGLAQVCVRDGRHEEAVHAIDLGIQERPADRADLLAERASVHAIAEQIDAAGVALDEAKAEHGKPLFIGLACAALGDLEGALGWIGRDPLEDWFALHAIRWDPRLRPMRQDARYERLLTRALDAWNAE